MKKILTLEQFINEQKKEKYPYGCSMIYFDFPQMKIIQEQIEDDDIQDLEGEPHVTLLYGLHSDEIEDDVILDISSKGIKSMGLGNVSLFENEDNDILKFDVEAPFLYDINKKLRKLPHTSDYPNYHPHCTIAYLKPGTGNKYVDLFKNRVFEVFPNKVVYTKPDGTRLEERFSL